MKLTSAKKRFKDEWLAFEYLDEAKEEGRVLVHAKNRHGLYQKLKKLDTKAPVYITYSGPIVPKGYAIVL